MVRGKTAIATTAALLGASLSLASPSLGGAVSAAPAAPIFGHTIDLGNAGGEPSLHDDGHGHVYIVTPLGTGSQANGVLMQRSVDGGQSFLPNEQTGNIVGGGDADVLS